MTLAQITIEELVRRALEEDLGHGGDATSDALIPADKDGRLVIRAREAGILAGTALAQAAFHMVEKRLEITAHLNDGARLENGTEIMTVTGPARAILSAERTALNFITHLSGIASQTGQYVRAIDGTAAAITCTRKTMPGLRAAQKYAVRIGGGKNHRFGLGDGILIKDNHIALAGGVGPAIKQARAHAGHMIKIEIEVDDLDQLEQALAHKIDAVLLDNMAPATLQKAVTLIDGRALAEASGGITLATVRPVAETGVDLISVGALTHSVTGLDIGLDIDV